MTDWTQWRREDIARTKVRLAREECPDCDGGIVRERHPLYGSPSCPEPYIERTCPECGGTGEVQP